MLLLLAVGLSCCLGSLVQAQQWNADNYPNPKISFKQCKMRSASLVCDPEEILTESERYRLHSDLQRFTARTEGYGPTFCNRKGFDALLAITREVPFTSKEKNSLQASPQLAETLNKKWNARDQCLKSLVFVLSSNDRKLYYSAAPNVPINPNEVAAILSKQQGTLGQGQFTHALTSIFRDIGDQQNARNSPPPQPQQPPPQHTRGQRPNSSTVHLISTLFSFIVLRLFLASF